MFRQTNSLEIPFLPSSLTTVNNCDTLVDSHLPKWLAKNSGSGELYKKGTINLMPSVWARYCHSQQSSSAVPKGFLGF